eukprot:Pgem_evm1s16848
MHFFITSLLSLSFVGYSAHASIPCGNVDQVLVHSLQTQFPSIFKPVCGNTNRNRREVEQASRYILTTDKVALEQDGKLITQLTIALEQANFQENLEFIVGSLNFVRYVEKSIKLQPLGPIVNKCAVSKSAVNKSAVNVGVDKLIWGLDILDGVLDNKLERKYTGDGVDAYIVDSGITYSHPQFENRSKLFYNAYSETQRDFDCLGHGTHCAGTIGSLNYGVAPKVSLYNVKVFNCDADDEQIHVLHSLSKILNERNKTRRAVVSMSIGDTDTAWSKTAQSLKEVAKDLYNDNVVVVAAAGNAFDDASSYIPANIPEIIAVGAVDVNLNMPDFSNYGAIVDILGPGVNIKSTDKNGFGIEIRSGTSMACPYVAGVIALLLEEFPTFSPLKIKAKLLERAVNLPVGKR